MRKYIKLISVLLLLALLISSLPIQVAAEDYVVITDDLSEAYIKLDALCWSAVYDYGVSSANRDSAYRIEPGVLILKLTNESLEKGREVLDETSNFLDGYTVEPETYTYEDFENQYTKLKNTLDSLVIDKVALKSLINFCLDEKNDKEYYNDELWNNFTEKVNNAQDVYGNDNIVEDYKVTEVFFELLHSYFELCSSNTMFGDIDGDDKITVKDATFLQKALAGIENFNSSQKLVSEFNITYATQIQKYLAQIESTLDIETSVIEDYIMYTEYSNIHSEVFRFESWKYNYFYVNYISDRNYPIYL